MLICWGLRLILVLEGVMMMLTALVISKYRCGPRSVTWNSRFLVQVVELQNTYFWENTCICSLDVYIYMI